MAVNFGIGRVLKKITVPLYIIVIRIAVGSVRKMNVLTV